MADKFTLMTEDEQGFRITPKGLWVVRRMDILRAQGVENAFAVAVEEAELAPEVRPIVTGADGRVLVF